MRPLSIHWLHVWRSRNTTFQQEHIVGTTVFGGGDFTVWGCFSLNCNFDYALSDSYPVTWLTKVVALLPPVADSLALYGLCGLALPSIRIGRLANGWPSKWGTTNERRIWSRYFCPHPVDGRVRIWRPRNTTFQQEHIVGTTAFGGGGFSVWGVCGLALPSIHITLNTDWDAWFTEWRDVFRNCTGCEAVMIVIDFR
jgi:predicted metal-binding membrane protein